MMMDLLQRYFSRTKNSEMSFIIGSCETPVAAAAAEVEGPRSQSLAPSRRGGRQEYIYNIT